MKIFIGRSLAFLHEKTPTMSILDTSPASADIILSNTRGNKAKLRRQAIGVASGIRSSDHFLGIVAIKSQPSYNTYDQKTGKINSAVDVFSIHTFT
jgi:hypothetical protein